MDIIHRNPACIGCLSLSLPLCPSRISLAPNFACVTTFGTESSAVVSLDISSMFSMTSGPLSCLVVLGLSGLEIFLFFEKGHDAIVLSFFPSPCAWYCMALSLVRIVLHHPFPYMFLFPGYKEEAFSSLSVLRAHGMRDT